MTKDYPSKNLMRNFKRVLATVANIKTLDKNQLSRYINGLSDGLSMSVLAAYVKRTKPSAALYDFSFLSINTKITDLRIWT